VSEPDDKWGERPVAFVVLKAGKSLTADIIFDHCRKLLAGYKVLI
jgi:fatty-acyl-CoA synthase